MKKSIIILLHIGYWLLYLLLVLSFMLALANSKYRSITAMGEMLFLTPVSVIAFLPGILGFYSFYTFLFNQFLNRKKIFALVIWGFVTILICGTLPVLLLSMPVDTIWHISGSFFEKLGMISFLSMLALVNGIIGLVMRGFITWYSEIRIKEELQRKNVEMELALVKSQLSPHFLFNTINNIDVLIEKDPVKASQYLNKLSDIMRFLLYESKSDKVPLEKELSYISKYIQLQQIRASNPHYIQYAVTGQTGNLMIEPMLFMPFIENAFKHAEHKKNTNAIKLNFTIDKAQVRFYCENKYSAELNNLSNMYGGLGNSLIEKRLHLLYPGKHELRVEKENGNYKVDLKIDVE